MNSGWSASIPAFITPSVQDEVNTKQYGVDVSDIVLGNNENLLPQSNMMEGLLKQTELKYHILYMMLTAKYQQAMKLFQPIQVILMQLHLINLALLSIKVQNMQVYIWVQQHLILQL